FREEVFNLITGSTDSSRFEEYRLANLGPRSYVLFTLNEVINRVIEQLCNVCPVAEDNSILETHEEVGGGDRPQAKGYHENTTC
ncbi:hypothetical protein ACJX0J_033965, partial [Zea mays]